MLLSHTSDIVGNAERLAERLPVGVVLDELRRLALGDFGLLLLTLPDARLPNLSRVLPRMASSDVQDSWTGTSGVTLLRQTVNFCRSLQCNYLGLTGRSLSRAKILDFGCGYGRIMRLMYWFTSPDRLYGVDPWEKSIGICREDNVLGQLAISDYLPTSLPIDAADFDLIYAFSVFTHLSERATRTALGTLRRYVAKDGLLVITVRPKEFWEFWASQRKEERAAAPLTERHDADGFAFLPHDRAAVDGEVTYGDTSISFDWLRQNIHDWKIAGYDRSLDDPLQLLVYLQPR